MSHFIFILVNAVFFLPNILFGTMLSKEQQNESLPFHRPDVSVNSSSCQMEGLRWTMDSYHSGHHKVQHACNIAPVPFQQWQ
ncbi:hypothetical protein SDJN02_19544, partial [Cucurbita argyrosperma subsp. argyrosperma]